MDYLKDLEIARHHIANKSSTVMAEATDNNTEVALLGWGEEEVDKDGFTPVLSNSTRKNIRTARRLMVEGLPSGSGKSCGGALAGCSAASVKVTNNHPLSGVVTGSRVRKKKPKYQ